MYLVNDGSFEIKEESVPKFLELWYPKNLLKRKKMLMSPNLKAWQK